MTTDLQVINNLEDIKRESGSSIYFPVLKKVPHPVVDKIVTKLAEENHPSILNFDMDDVNIPIDMQQNSEIMKIIYGGIGLFSVNHNMTFLSKRQSDFITMNPKRIVAKLEMFKRLLVTEFEIVEYSHGDGISSQRDSITKLNRLAQYLYSMDNPVINIANFISRDDSKYQTTPVSQFNVSIRTNTSLINLDNNVLQPKGTKNSKSKNNRNALYLTNNNLYYVDTLRINFSNENGLINNKAFVVYLMILDIFHSLVKTIIDISNKDALKILSVNCIKNYLRYDANMYILNNGPILPILDKLCEFMDIFSIKMDMAGKSRWATFKNNSLIQFTSK